MKHKKLFRSVTALLAALVLMGGFSVTAFAGGGDVSDEPPTPVTETEPEETTGGYEPHKKALKFLPVQRKPAVLSVSFSSQYMKHCHRIRTARNTKDDL